MAEPSEELDSLFDYSRVQPDVLCIDDDDSDSSPVCAKKRKVSSTHVEKKVEGNGKKVVDLVDVEDEEDWLLPPPVVTNYTRKNGSVDSTIKELRSRKMELASFAKSAKDVLQAVDESAKKDVGISVDTSPKAVDDQPTKPSSERLKIVISVQDKQGLQQFRVFVDDRFGRLFKTYADKFKHDIKHLVFCFDGDKISPEATPQGLGMEDDDIIEVHNRSS